MLTAKGLLIVAAVLFTVAFGVTAVNAAAEKTAAGEDVANSCAQCHEDMAKAFAANPHRALGATCTDCHGRTEKHVEEGGALETIVTFSAKDGRNVMQANRQCLQCHKTSVARYMAGPHGQASMACTQCHAIHAKEPGAGLLKEEKVKLCVSCHRDVYAEFQRNEKHRLQEGVMECTTCHNPHEPANRQRLGGFKDEKCLSCHTEKGGPFIHEHEASRIEGCVACHDVHGSANRHMLKHQNLAELCFSCHGETPSWHQGFTRSETNCVSCHAAIHGSNLDRLFLK